MNPLSLVWDVLFVDSSINEKNTSRKMIDSMGAYVGVPVRDLMNWNTVMKGQKTSGAGFTSGLRYVIDVSEDSASSLIELANRLLSFEDELCAISSVSLAEKLPIPLDRKTRKSFPEIGRLMLSVRFTHGLGYDDAKKIKNAMGTQTKETKDGLNPIGPATGIRTRQGGSVLPGVNSPGRGELLRRGGDGGGARRGVGHGGRAERGRERMFVYLETGGAAQGWASSGWGREERPRKSMYGDLCGGRVSARRRSDAEAGRWRVARRARTMVRRECQTGRRWRESRVRASDNIKCH